MALTPAPRKKAKVLCAGAATMDTIFRVPELPSGPGKILPLEAVEIAAGMASSAAVAICRLGGAASLWGRIGGDATGEKILAGLSAEGVNCSAVTHVPNARSAFSTILVDQVGERIVIPFYDPALFDGAAGLPTQSLTQFDCVLVDVRWPDGASAVLEAACTCGIPSVLDADVAPPSALARLVPLASHVVFSTPAALSFTGASVIADALSQLSERLSGFIAITAGSEGCFWFDRRAGSVRQIAAPAVDVVDTLSAGDAFHGAFALGLAERKPIEEIVDFANVVAALKCTRFGGRSGLPTRKEVEQYIECREIARRE